MDIVWIGLREQLAPVCRVDIFRTQGGRLVVNEIEGLEAQVIPKDDRTYKLRLEIEAWLTKYWIDVIRSCINKC